MIISILLTIVIILLTVAFFTVFERKLMASVQRRVGPGFYSKFYGVGQGIFDGVKLLFTEIVLPKRYVVGFILAPVLNFVFSFLS